MTADRSPPRGRTAASNRTSRHRAHAAEAVDDGWPGELPGVDPRTKTFTDAARSAISRNGSPDVPFGRSLNPYRGCEHGCIYRYARPTQAERVWARIREVRGGATSESAFGRRHRSSGTYAELLALCLAVAHRRLGYGPPPELVTDRFRPPGAPGAPGQMALC